ncbi:hypothetical protein [Thiomonas sp.]|uniref:hypothetical protein n=1 Tax=Thiomonas sp. TaxID=2047785 RepID=UPI0025848420|nr:hypothetical protein [Thiomonas sp.]
MNAQPQPRSFTLMHLESNTMVTVKTREAFEAGKLIDQLPPALQQEVMREIASIRARLYQER